MDITLWGRTAEVAHQYSGKGKPLFVEGRLHMDSWDDKTSGQKRTKLKVVADNIQLMGAPGGGSGGGGGGQPPQGGQGGNPAPQQQQQQAQQQPPQEYQQQGGSPAQGGQVDDDGEIPF